MGKRTSELWLYDYKNVSIVAGKSKICKGSETDGKIKDKGKNANDDSIRVFW